MNPTSGSGAIDMWRGLTRGEYRGLSGRRPTPAGFCGLSVTEPGPGKSDTLGEPLTAGLGLRSEGGFAEVSAWGF